MSKNASMYIRIDPQVKANVENGQDILITESGKHIAKIVDTKIDKTAAIKSIIGIIPPDTDLDRAKEERLL